jgi:hypothetical protein
MGRGISALGSALELLHQALLLLRAQLAEGLELFGRGLGHFSGKGWRGKRRSD